MKKVLLISFHFILTAGFMDLSIFHALAQPPDPDKQIGLRLQTLATGEKLLSWTGQENHTFFIQASPDLFDWTWAPNIEPGLNGPMSYEVDGPTAKGFFRLIRTDQTAADPDTADFDNDGLGNLHEITPRPRPGGIVGHAALNSNIQTNPIDSDTDHDGLDDKWEQDHGLDPTDNGSRNINNGPNGDPDGDGDSNLVEYVAGTMANDSSDFTVQIYAVTRVSLQQHNDDPLAEENGKWLNVWGNWNASTLISTLSPVALNPPQIGLDLASRVSYPTSLPTVAQRLPIPTGGIYLEHGSFTRWSETFGTTTTTYTISGLRQSRLWMKIPANRQATTTQRIPYVFVSLSRTYGYGAGGIIMPPGGEHPDQVVDRCSIVEFEFDPGANTSKPLDVDAQLTGGGLNTQAICDYRLLPVEVAPEVLAVNSDFDEGRIDPATGYAIPDCDDMAGVDLKTGAGNTKLELGAERNHLDGTFTQGQHVIDDLNKGWFGVNPSQLGDDFWAGANVTIRKIDKIDSDTGYKESGQVRFYARWDGGHYGITPYDFQTLQPVNLVSAGVNLRPSEGVYGTSSTIPDGAEFYMEGVRPGKITLEWRLQKGTVDVKHEQTFKVVTQKALDAWRDELRYQIRLQTSVAGEEVDLNDFDPIDEFTSNTKFLKATYGWYQQNFIQSEDKLIWAGMAKMAGAPVYAALSDAQVARAVGPGIGVELIARQLQRALMKGNKDIFLDLAWQHRAYAASGILAIKFVDDNDESVGLRAVQMTDWVLIDQGFWQDSLFKSSLGARELLRREQRFIIENVYLEIVALGLDEIISVLAENPIPNLPPLGRSFAEVVQVGNLAVFDDRWRWIKSDMYPGWTGIGEFSLDLGLELSGGSGGYGESERLSYAQIGLSSRARNYATFPNSVP